MKKVLKEEDIYQGNLILVNSFHPIKKEIDKDNLDYFNRKYPNILIAKVLKKSLQEVLKKIDSKDKIVPVSGYRSLTEQQEIYDNSIIENGIEFTKKYVAYPNCSEHQTGLAIDLGLNEGIIDFIRPAFPRTGICEKFREEMSKYGLIERYTEDKQKTTKISNEEWHFRYVGYPHSKIMKEKNLCLEEYIKYLKTYKDKNLKYENYEICYLPYLNREIEIELKEEDTVSGNNIDGFIITRRIK